MTNEILEYLEQLELTEGEAKLYLTLLKHGVMTVTALAKAAGVYRTAAYSPIDRLIEKGLVMELVKGSRSLVAATQLEENLQHLVEQKIQKDKIIQEKLPDIIRTLQKSIPQTKPSEDAQIRYYNGINAVRKIYQEALKANELRSYAKLEGGVKVFPNNIEVFNDGLKRNLKLTIKELVYDSPVSKKEAEYVSNQIDRYSYKIMPKDLRISSEDILMYDGNVSIINYTGKITSMVLHSKDYYNNSTELFDYLWKTLP
jgi:sugar-specific transcriptional regulator TrmB